MRPINISVPSEERPDLVIKKQPDYSSEEKSRQKINSLVEYHFSQHFRDLVFDSKFLVNMLMSEVESKKSLTDAELLSITRRLNRWAECYKTPCCEFMTSHILTSTANTVELRLIEKTMPHLFSKNSDDVIRLFDSYRGEIVKIYQTYPQSGVYFLNNYIVKNSRQLDYRDAVGVRAVALAVWNLDYDKADFLLKSSKGEIESAVLRPLIKGFRNIVLLARRDKDTEQALLYRQLWNIAATPETETNNSKPTHSFNVLCCDLTEDNFKEFAALTKNKRVLILKQCLESLVQSASSASMIPSTDPYFRSLIAFLGNQVDRRDSNCDQVLGVEGLLLIDKFMLAHKFLFTRLNEFRKHFIDCVEKTSNLNNLIFCPTAKEKKSILQNYLDETSDLETVSYLSLFEKYRYKGETTIFDSFITDYRDNLRRGGNLRKLEYLSRKEKQYRDREKTVGTLTTSSVNTNNLLSNMVALPTNSTPARSACTEFFMRTIDFQTLKINQPLGDSLQGFVCSVCSLDIRNGEEQQYIQCLKCRHGGHPKHILGWFSHNQRCARSDCVCLCN